MAREVLDTSCSGRKGDDWVTIAVPVKAVEWPVPLWHPAIPDLCEGQNVAGMWLKYG